MAELIQNTNYSTNLRLLLEQYKDKDNLKGLIDADNVQANDIEAALFEIRNLFWIATATGVQLDIIGKIMGIERKNRTDVDYAILLTAAAAIANDPTPETIISALKILYDATSVIYRPFYPAKFYLFTDATITLPELEIISPSGVGVLFGSQLFSGNYDPIFDGDTNPIYAVFNHAIEGTIIDEEGDELISEAGEPLLYLG